MADTIKIAVKVNGGFGTILVRANFLHCLYEYLGGENVQITVFGHKSQKMNDAIFQGQKSIYAYYPEEDWIKTEAGGFDLRFTLDLYPDIHDYKGDTISSNEKLRTVFDAWQSLKLNKANDIYFHKLRESKPYLYTWMIIQHKTVLNSADVRGILGVGSEYRMPILTNADCGETLEKFGLKGKKFITLQRGINPKLATTENPKMWPVEYYEDLIRLIHEEFREYVLVQLGESSEHCKVLNGIDLNLLGQTSWDDLKILLKEATLHIDGECGMVHLRKALHAGPSIVLFGPTPLAFFGYDGNLNLKSNGCAHWCAELRDDWEYRCIRDREEAPCLRELRPETVFQEIRRYLNGDKSHLYQLEKCPGSKTEELLKKQKTDSEYATNFLQNDTIWDYEYVKVPLKKLMCHVYYENGWSVIPLAESPAYRYVCGDEKAYAKNMQFRDRTLSDNVHSLERFNALIRSVKESGYQAEDIIIIGADNVIRDGQHRAAILMHMLGEDAEMTVLRVYRCIK